MNTSKNINNGLLSGKPFFPALKTIVATAALLVMATNVAQAQDTSAPKFTRPSWWFGAAVGANINFYNGSTQRLTDNFMIPATFNKGLGVGLFLGPLVEYHAPETRWGFMFQAGYDNRKGKYEQILTPCNCPADLTTKISYITVEPNLRFAPFKGNFYLFAGPRFAFLYNNSFTYKQSPNPAYPEQVASPAVEGELSEMKQTIISMQIGAGIDIPLSSTNHRTQWALSPFVSYHPYFGQNPRTIETWNLQTVRAGIAIKFGRGRSTSAEDVVDKKDKDAAVVLVTPEVDFTVDAPKNIPVQRSIRETFPLRNYVFFDKGSSKIPPRYVLLQKSQVNDFKEDQLEVYQPKNLSGRSKRQMVAYYNILNIVGDRMNKNPDATIKLVGSSEQGEVDGKAMAESIKKYLVDVFSIAPNRIETVGNDKPTIPSEVKGGTKELALLSEGNRRVTIKSTTPAMLMEFQSGPDAPLKPVELKTSTEAPLDSYVTINADGATDAFKSWSIEVRDEKGKLQTFGPYTQDAVSIPGKAILGKRAKGDYRITMVGITHDNKIVKKETTAHLVLWTPPTTDEGLRYSVLFDYNATETAAMYEKYLKEVVAPKIPIGATVIIHGFSDIVGNTAYNQKLSQARAIEVKNILAEALSAKGRKDVKLQANGFGEDSGNAPFTNKTPEERFYNRTVVIDILPASK